jgi:voltage-gated potassium channel
VHPAHEVWAKMRPALAALVAVAALGTLCLHWAFGGSWAVNLYRAVTIMSTLGDQRLVPATTFQYTVVGGLSLLGYAGWGVVVAVVAGTLVALDLSAVWGGRRMEERIAQMSGHTVVLGGGRVGTHAAEELIRQGVPVVVVEHQPELRHTFEALGCPVLIADALEDGVLERAGLKRAGGVVLALPDDAANLYAILAVREINPTVPAVARAESVRAERQLLSLGVGRVVMPTRLGGARLARLVAQPLATEFLDRIVDEADIDIREVDVAEGMDLVGESVSAAAGRMGARATVLCVRRDGRLLALPDASLPIAAGDTLLVAMAHDAS